MSRCLPLLLVLCVSFAGHPSDARGQSLAEVARKEAERRKGGKTTAKVYTNKDLRPVSPAAARPADADASAAATSDTSSQSSADERLGGGGDRPPVPVEQPSAPDASRTANEASQGASTGEVADDQARWGARMKELQAALERDQTYADALQSRINALTTDFVNRDDPAQRAVIAADRQKAIVELERLKTQIEDDRAAVAALQEEARRAGVPPGWLR
jgi:hypothetical protein